MNFKQELIKDTKSVKEYLTTFLNWTFLSCFVGVSGGLVGVAFYQSVAFATALREATPYFIYFLPIAGLLITALYHIMGLEKDPGTNLLITSVVAYKQKVPQRMAFLIFTCTVLTHMFGGSVGREGAALQLGGCCGSGIGRLFHLKEHDRKLITMCGMSALFSAVFGTPIAATVFVIEFISIGIMHYSALVPCLTAAYIAKFVALAFGIKGESFVIAEVLPFELFTCGKVVVVGMACAIAGIMFCVALHTVGHFLHDKIKNDYLRIFVGGSAVVVGTLLVGNTDYNGAGAHIIEHAIEGHAVWYAFLLKILFTAVSMGAGYKGGEIVPSFFIGSTMGCVLGPLLGLPPSMAAGLGLIGVCCAVVNCPLASIILSLELFGAEMFPFCAIICVVSYMMSGPYSLYSSQRLLYSKLRPEYINQQTM